VVEKIQVGLASDPLNTTLSPTALIKANYLTAVSSGIDSLWVPDHLNSLLARAIATPENLGIARVVPKVDAYLEPWTILGHLAARNRIGRLRLGIGVTDAGRRNPAVTAQAAATLHLLTRGRAILGIGAGEREGNEPYGVDWRRPVGRLEEALATIRALWDSQGQLVTRDSPHFPLRKAVFDVPPYRGRRPQIWVAAHGPRTLGITGRYGDAWFPGFPQTPDDYANRLHVVRSAASDAGRDPMSVLPATWLFVITGRSRDDVDAVLDSDIARSFALNISADFWARHGVRHPFGDDFAGFSDVLPQTLDAADVLAAAAAVPRKLMEAAFLTGTPDDIVDQAAEWRDYGVRYFVLGNLSVLQPNLRRALRAGVPLGRVLRGFRKL
jgi:phthiodiolone/phenolphthiodiolone dimycocerosates ketoreductase